jgi:hypothetical protein
MALTGSTITLIAVSVVLIIVVLAIFLVTLRRLRARRDAILNELGSKPALVQDRAFNRLAMARREADVLARTGTDTSRAQELIAQSQGAFDTHDFPRSYELAQSAHEALVNAHGRVGVPSSAVPRSPGVIARPPAAEAPTSAGPAPPPPAPLPRNRAESQFQLRLLDQEVATARADRPKQAATVDAVNLQGQSQAAFDRADYTEAFRLALRARRTLGGKVEALAPPLRVPVAVRTGIGSAAPEDPASAADRVAAANRCSSCGYPAMPEDTFCRGCGTPRTASVCASCGGPRAPGDTFCGRCGVSFSG